MNRQNGFHVVEGILVVVVVVIMGAMGYLAYANLWAPKPLSTASTASNASTAPVQVASTKDLTTVSSDLDQLSVDDNELNQLDSASNSF